MRHLSSLKLARAVPDPDDSREPCVFLIYKVFGCVQSKNANLEDLPQPAEHRFAVINPYALDDDGSQILKAARDLGALSPVKLMDVRGDFIYIFLDAKVGSTTFAAIESLWSTVMRENAHCGMAVHFASENEIYSGRSDYGFWWGAKEILESEALGLMPLVQPAKAAPMPKKHRGDFTEPYQSSEQRDESPMLPFIQNSRVVSDKKKRPGSRGKNIVEPKPQPETLTLEQFKIFWDLIERRWARGPRSTTAEYCQRMARTIRESELEMLTPKKKRCAKVAPRDIAFGGREELAIARAELERREAKLFQEFLERL